MFSFFKTKKTSPSSSDEDPIPSASSDFEIVNPMPGGSQPNPNTAPYPSYPYPIYPNFNNSGNPSVSPYPPALPTRPQLQHSDSVNYSYLSGVPFKLSPKLSKGNNSEIVKMQLDEILASITSKMYITQLDYDFTLERSILQQQDETDSTAPEAENEAEPEVETATADE